MSLAFTPDGATLAAGGFDERISLIDTATWEVRGTIEVGEGIITLAISPDRSIVAAGTESGAVVFHRADTLQRIGEAIHSQSDWVNGLAFSLDAQGLSAGSEDGSVVMLDRLAWTDDIDYLRERLCAVAGRNLTSEGWASLLPDQAYRATCEASTP